MKKAILLLGAVLALAACSKTVTVVDEDVNPVSINPVSSVLTRGAEVVGTEFPTDLPIFVGASTAEQSLFLPNQKFAYNETDNWWAVNGSDEHAAVYWPIGGKTVDFLAYAVNPADADIPTPAFDATTAAKKFTVTGWDVDSKQADLLYAVANGEKSKKAAVDMEFQHALALIVFNVRFNTGGGVFSIKNITFGNKYTTGTLEVNNERNKLDLIWSSLSESELKVPATTAATYATEIVGANGAAAGCKKYGDAITLGGGFFQLGETLLVIPQAASNPVITYTLDGKDYKYEANAIRLNWEAGKAYIYDLSFNNNEILIAPTVKDWIGIDASTGEVVYP